MVPRTTLAAIEERERHLVEALSLLVEPAHVLARANAFDTPRRPPARRAIGSSSSMNSSRRSTSSTAARPGGSSGSAARARSVWRSRCTTVPARRSDEPAAVRPAHALGLRLDVASEPRCAPRDLAVHGTSLRRDVDRLGRCVPASYAAVTAWQHARGCGTCRMTPSTSRSTNRAVRPSAREVTRASHRRGCPFQARDDHPSSPRRDRDGLARA